MKPGEASHYTYPKFDFPDLPAAVCAQVDPELFFPQKGESSKNAKKICRICEAQPDCLKWALNHDERFGIWAGLSWHQRKKLRKTDAT